MRRSRRRTAAISAKGLSDGAANGRLASQVADRTPGVQSPPTEEGSGSHCAGTASAALPAPSLGPRSYRRRSRPGGGETSRCRYSVARPTQMVCAISVIVLPPSSIWRVRAACPRSSPRVAADPAPGARSGQAFLGVLGDQVPRRTRPSQPARETAAAGPGWWCRSPGRAPPAPHHPGRAHRPPLYAPPARVGRPPVSCVPGVRGGRAWGPAGSLSLSSW